MSEDKKKALRVVPLGEAKKEKDPDAPAEWDRLPGETGKAWAAFQVYLGQGPGRSLEQTGWKVHPGGRSHNAKPVGQRKRGQNGRIKVWSTKYDWKRRALAYDDHLARIAHDERIRAEEARGEEYAKRKKELVDTEWELAQSLIDKAKEMLRFPLVTVEKTEIEEDGVTQKITVIQPTKWNMRDAARMFDVASKLARLSVDLETSKIGLSTKGAVAVEEKRQALLNALQDPEARQAAETLSRKLSVVGGGSEDLEE